MTISSVERAILEVVRDSEGRWDGRNIDFEYYRRSQVVPKPSLPDVLLDLEARGLIVRVHIAGGTGPGWRLTPAGTRALVDAEES